MQQDQVHMPHKETALGHWPPAATTLCMLAHTVPTGYSICLVTYRICLSSVLANGTDHTKTNRRLCIWATERHATCMHR